MTVLKLSELVTDPPSNAKVCQRCGGFGIIVTWAGFMQSSNDCLVCEGRGWIIKTKKAG